MTLDQYAEHLTAAAERVLSEEGLSWRDIANILESALAERPAGLVGKPHC
jgi:hypothetical protein